MAQSASSSGGALSFTSGEAGGPTSAGVPLQYLALLCTAGEGAAGLFKMPAAKGNGNGNGGTIFVCPSNPYNHKHGCSRGRPVRGRRGRDKNNNDGPSSDYSPTLATRKRKRKYLLDGRAKRNKQTNNCVALVDCFLCFHNVINIVVLLMLCYCIVPHQTTTNTNQ